MALAQLLAKLVITLAAIMNEDVWFAGNRLV
jgi:hypothetical protein